jgi:PBP1b-binding outer membrane lipoprotein LpoB
MTTYEKLSVSLISGALALATSVAGCANREVVRDSEDPSINSAAMSTSLDKDDMQRSLHKLLNNLRESPVMQKWRAHHSPKDTVAIAPFINTTSEHIDSQLDVMLSETETWLVQSAVASVIDRERQLEMIRAVEGSQHPVFNPARIPQYGKQLSAKYYITGKVGAADERTEDARRVQYFIFMKVINVETSELEWQEKAEITKMVR